jgi:hypothetical protein
MVQLNTTHLVLKTFLWPQVIMAWYSYSHTIQLACPQLSWLGNKMGLCLGQFRYGVTSWEPIKPRGPSLYQYHSYPSQKLEDSSWSLSLRRNKNTPKRLAARRFIGMQAFSLYCPELSYLKQLKGLCVLYQCGQMYQFLQKVLPWAPLCQPVWYHRW